MYKEGARCLLRPFITPLTTDLGSKRLLLPQNLENAGGDALQLFSVGFVVRRLTISSRGALWRNLKYIKFGTEEGVDSWSIQQVLAIPGPWDIRVPRIPTAGLPLSGRKGHSGAFPREPRSGLWPPHFVGLDRHAGRHVHLGF